LWIILLELVIIYKLQLTECANNIIIYIITLQLGFSFTEDEAGYPTSGQAAAPDMYEFLLQFFEMFPQLQQNDFYNSGASFGGKYIV